MGKGIALLAALAAACAPAGCIANFECTGDGCPDSGGASGDGGLDADVGALDTGLGPEGEGDTGGDTGAWNEGGQMCTAPPKVLACPNGGCVDPTSDTSNCGGCGMACKGPASMHGTATCAPAAGAEGGADAGSGMCGISCVTGYHPCSGDCLSDGDPPSATSDPCVIDDAFGTFVAPVASGGSDTNGSGTKAAPFATLGHALANLKHGRVYLCNATYSEQVAIKGAVGVYGGLACPGGDAGASAWSYVGGHAQIAGPQNAAALTISAGGGAVDIEDVAVSAPNASGQDTAGNGNSSIAVLVSGSNDVAFRRCALSAGNGADAVQSKPPVQGNYTNGPIAPSGSANNTTTGGAGGATTGADACGSGSSSTGGAGGTVGMNGGAAGGGSSTPAATVGVSTGYDGKGGVAGAVGDTGASGAAGNGGVAATGYGTLSASGWTPSQGGNGGAGGPGQGGGGGGIKNAPQAGGTGGGAGGCGGAGGLGGAGGGASIALASVASTVTLDNGCTLSTGTGGNGQPGGDGQVGQEGGLPGSNSLTVAGGQGGNGAGGSGGAGGTGGSSVCIVFSAPAPSSMASCTSTAAGGPGSAGSGNSGGDNGDLNPGASGNSGSAGLAGTTTSPMQLH